MLTLGLRSGEYIVIGDNIVIKAVQVDNQVQLAIEAPRDMAILREAVYEQTHPTPECIVRLQERDRKKRSKAPVWPFLRRCAPRSPV